MSTERYGYLVPSFKEIQIINKQYALYKYPYLLNVDVVLGPDHEDHEHEVLHAVRVLLHALPDRLADLGQGFLPEGNLKKRIIIGSLPRNYYYPRQMQYPTRCCYSSLAFKFVFSNH